MPSRIIIENTDQWRVDSIGNGWAYEFTYKPDIQTGWLQDDNALQWREDYDAMQEASCNPQAVWYKRTWNQCLAEIIAPFMDMQQ